MLHVIQKLFILVSILIVGVNSPIYADFYIIPIVKKFKNVVSVAKSGGSYTNPVAALNSITDASVTNPYLVYIGPGVYTLTETLRMKPYVHIIGSGMDVTKLIGNASSGTFSHDAIVEGWTNASLQELTVEHGGGSQLSYGIYNFSTSPTLHRIRVVVTGNNFVFGIYNKLSSSKISQTYVEVTGGSEEARGIYNDSATPSISDTKISVDNLSIAFGIYNKNSNFSIKGTSIEIAGGGANRYGIYNENSNINMKQMQITVSDGIDAVGIYNSNGGTSTFSHSYINVAGASSSNYGIQNDNSQIILHHSDLVIKSVGVKTVLSENGGAMRATHSVLHGGGSKGNNLCGYCSDVYGTILQTNCLP